MKRKKHGKWFGETWSNFQHGISVLDPFVGIFIWIVTIHDLDAHSGWSRHTMAWVPVAFMSYDHDSRSRLLSGPRCTTTTHDHDQRGHDPRPRSLSNPNEYAKYNSSVKGQTCNKSKFKNECIPPISRRLKKPRARRAHAPWGRSIFGIACCNFEDCKMHCIHYLQVLTLVCLTIMRLREVQ